MSMLKGQGLIERLIEEEPKERRRLHGQMVVVKHDKEEQTRQTLHSRIYAAVCGRAGSE